MLLSDYECLFHAYGIVFSTPVFYGSSDMHKMSAHYILKKKMGEVYKEKLCSCAGQYQVDFHNFGIVVTIIYFVLLIFSVNLCIVNQLQPSTNPTCMSISSSVGDLALKSNTASSAYMLTLHPISEIDWGREFMYIINKSGPKIEPWGTPCWIKFKADTLSSTFTFCFLSVKYSYEPVMFNVHHACIIQNMQ